MTTFGINFVAVIVAAIVAFAWGAAWYMALSKPWMAAARMDPASIQPSATPFIISFVALLVMGAVTSILVGLTGYAGLGAGLLLGFWLWLGFIATTLAVNHRYQNFGWDLTLIDAGHWLGVALIIGGVVGWFA